MISTNCPEFGDKIIGREDRKFCSDACPNAFSNKINKDTINYMRSINNKLRRNYHILTEANAGGKTKITKSKLLSKGLDSGYFTSLLLTKNGNTYYFVYKQDYRTLGNEYYILAKKYIS